MYYFIRKLVNADSVAAKVWVFTVNFDCKICSSMNLI